MEVLVSERRVKTTGPVPSGVAEGLKIFVIKGKTRILVYEDVTILIALEICTENRAVVLSYLSTHRDTGPARISQLKIIHAFYKSEDLVRVL